MRTRVGPDSGKGLFLARRNSAKFSGPPWTSANVLEVSFRIFLPIDLSAIDLFGCLHWNVYHSVSVVSHWSGFTGLVSFTVAWLVVCVKPWPHNTLLVVPSLKYFLFSCLPSKVVIPSLAVAECPDSIWHGHTWPVSYCQLSLASTAPPMSFMACCFSE